MSVCPGWRLGAAWRTRQAIGPAGRYKEVEGQLLAILEARAAPDQSSAAKARPATLRRIRNHLALNEVVHSVRAA